VDKFLSEDLNRHTVKDVPFQDFLHYILGLGPDFQNSILETLPLPEYDSSLQAYKASEQTKREKTRYVPFCNWVNYIITEVEKSVADCKGTKLTFNQLGNKLLDSKFPGRRYPDIPSSNSNELPKSWAASLTTGEIKPSNLASSKRKCREQEGGSAQMKSKNSATASKTPLSSPGFTAVEDGAKEMVGTPHIRLEPEEAVTDYPSAVKLLDPEVQLSNHASQMLCSAEIRNWTVAYLIQGDFLTLWYYDRTRAISTVAIKFKEPGQGKNLFFLFIIALTKCSMKLDKLGFSDKFIKKSDNPEWPGKLDGPNKPAEYRYLHFKSCEPEKVHILSDDANASDLLNKIPGINIDKKSTIARIEMSDPVHRQYTLFGRATRVGNVVLGTNDNGTFQ